MTYVEFSSLTWPEASRLGERDDVVGLIPVAAVEQHGPHLPLSTDWLIAGELGRRIAKGLLETVIVAPVVPGGLSSHHIEFPGTVNLPEPVFEGALTAYVDAFVRMGVRRVAILSGHGGNFAFLERYQKEQAARDGVRVAAYLDMLACMEAMFAGARRAGLDPAGCDTHAGLVETSMILAIAPHLVRDFEGVDGYTANEPDFLQRALHNGLRSLTDSGVLGHPSGATAAAGEEALAVWTSLHVSWMVTALDCTSSATTRLKQAVA